MMNEPESEARKILRDCLDDYNKAFQERQQLKPGFKLIQKKKYEMEYSRLSRNLEETFAKICEIAEEEIGDFNRIVIPDKPDLTIAKIRNILGPKPFIMSDPEEHFNPGR